MKKTVAGAGTFSVIVDNIIGLVVNVDNIDMLLRINYTKQNLPSSSSIINLIPSELRGKIKVAFQQVWQTTNEQIDASYYVGLFASEGFDASRVLDKKNYRCYADLRSQSVILPNRDVFKCTARDFKNHAPDGYLSENGIIYWNSICQQRLSKTTIEQQECLACSILPVCWGPCSQKLLEKDKLSFAQICNIDGYRKTIEQVLNDYYEKNNIENRI